MKKRLQRSVLLTALTGLSILPLSYPAVAEPNSLFPERIFGSSILADIFERSENNRRRDRRGERLESLVVRIDEEARDLRRTVDRELDRSRLNGRRGEDQINELVREFNSSTRQLRREVQRRNRARSEARDVLNQGARVERVLSRRRFSREVREQWNVLRRDLSILAEIYDVDDWPNLGRR